MKPGHPLREFFRQCRWHARGTLLVWSAAATFGALAFAGLARLGWIAEHPERNLIAVAVAALLLAAWFVRVRRLTPRGLARELDARWDLRARLESALELAGHDSSWAVAQRDDTTQAVAARPAPGAPAWRAGQFLLAAVAALLLVEGAALFVHALRAPSAAAAKSSASAADDARGTIEWKSPDPEIKATSIEEVPLTALAESKTGFRSFSIEVIVNGDREISQPLAPDAGDSAKPGAHEITPSLFLDEIQVKPFDVLSYRLVGELNTLGPKRTVASLPQIIQIRPPQKDVKAVGQGSSEFPARLFALKDRQIRLIKQNATLAQLADRAERDPTWAPENARVADEQTKLAAGAADLRAWVKNQHPPALVTANLAAAEAEMKAAGKSIAAAKNDAAEKPQNHALALLTELEQFINRAMTGGSAVNDPIRDEQTFKLPSRSETPAGQLEELAARQQKLNNELGATPGGTSSSGGDPKGEEAAIARAAAELGSSDSFSPDVRKEVAAAATAADDAARQLGLGDLQAARVPAAAAQRALERAVEAQEKAGRAAAVAELEQLRRTLNAARRASASERAEQLTVVRTALRTAAAEQLRTGSAEAAQELVQIADLIGGEAPAGKRGGGAARATPNSAEQIHEVAAAAAHAQVLLSAHTSAVRRAVRLLNRSGERANTPPAKADASERARSVELAAQEAEWLTTDAATIELARQTADRADALLRAAAVDLAKARELEDAATKLAAALEHGRAAIERERIARNFNPAEVDPAYREAIEDYFERLSREARRAPPKIIPP